MELFDKELYDRIVNDFPYKKKLSELTLTAHKGGVDLTINLKNIDDFEMRKVESIFGKFYYDELVESDYYQRKSNYGYAKMREVQFVKEIRDELRKQISEKLIRQPLDVYENIREDIKAGIFYYEK